MSNRWSISEQIRYHFFLALNLHSFRRKKKNVYRFFPVMAEFIGNNRDLNQCRAHHQKRTKKFPIETVLHQFCEQYYLERTVPLEHSLLQFQLILNQKENLTELLNRLFPKQATPMSKQELAREMYKGLHQIATKDKYKNYQVQTEPVKV